MKYWIIRLEKKSLVGGTDKKAFKEFIFILEKGSKTQIVLKTDINSSSIANSKVSCLY